MLKAILKSWSESIAGSREYLVRPARHMIEVNVITFDVRGIIIRFRSIPDHSTIHENGYAGTESRHSNLAGRIGRRGDAHVEL